MAARVLSTDDFRASVFHHNLPRGNVALTAPLFAGIELYEDRPSIAGRPYAAPKAWDDADVRRRALETVGFEKRVEHMQHRRAQAEQQQALVRQRQAKLQRWQQQQQQQQQTQQMQQMETSVVDDDLQQAQLQKGEQEELEGSDEDDDDAGEGVKDPAMTDIERI